MAKRVVGNGSITPTATADTTNLADATYPLLIQGGTSTQRILIWEVMLAGQATTATPTLMQLARDSTVAVTNSLGANQTDGPFQTATAALAAAPLVGNTNTTKPQRSSTLKILPALSLQCYGGVIRWAALDPTECPDIVGNTASNGEVSLSAFTGGTPGALSAHIVYEPL